jgi:uncharacterized protein
LTEIDDRTLILKVDVGSRGMGINTLTSDHDHKGVCIEDFSVHMSLGAPFEQFGPKKYGVDEVPGYAEGLDLEVYSLRKFLLLALKGNPNILSMLFHPSPILRTDEGRLLQELTPKILSRRAASAFRGYMFQQKAKLENRGRPQLVDKYGFDVKFAMHLIRIGLQGVELLSKGTITLPIPEPFREHLLDIREGKVSAKAIYEEALDLEEQIALLAERTELPDEPDVEYVGSWMRTFYWGAWQHRAFLEETFQNGDLTIH